MQRSLLKHSDKFGNFITNRISQWVKKSERKIFKSIFNQNGSYCRCTRWCNFRRSAVVWSCVGKRADCKICRGKPAVSAEFKTRLAVQFAAELISADQIHGCVLNVEILTKAISTRTQRAGECFEKKMKQFRSCYPAH